MLPQWIIEKKRDGKALTEEEIRSFIGAYAKGDLPDYQMAAMAMAIFIRGMNPQEIAWLTDAMMRSGHVLNTKSIKKPKVDKHSTGGIGDKVSLILAPLAASVGLAVPMISGRGLGITGGTLDKLESIPNYRTNLTEAQFISVVKKIGCSIIGQTSQLAPADKKLYALRDVTGTVASIPLITASIMCKKLAEGLDGLLLDVKCGKGAFMTTHKDARALALSMVRVGNAMGKRMAAIITNMNQPLGDTAGNALEVVESIETLQNKGPADLTEITIASVEEMMVLGRVTKNRTAARKQLEKNLADGTAFRIFREMVKLQGGDVRAIDDPSRLPQAKLKVPFAAPSAGYVALADAESIGKACVVLGAGRVRTDQAVDFAVGVSGIRHVGDKVNKGDPLLVIHANDKKRLADAQALLKQAYKISKSKPKQPPLIFERINGDTIGKSK
ncbi:MAG: thymidine phosphorylase [Kiritimatiellae bacterium]|nr:thymidine phosphorylase [Kiritimatiellia bacterium]